ncbi:hypothetical protein [Alysiella crassa]|uniref:Uncharacterized protein n=1 Tax=Alysiella crassa TaxID=153491 RepID=A0A376BUJ7_9NEIS|nr:hypothetical protein [Alysiella crassa]UOP06153.1 hypothetical protein LVJ80_09995 [Alysiella crassa]SSY80626.1 Uncharacterised protein [Alysiella crassa]
MANYLISSGLLFSTPPPRSGARSLLRRNVQFQSIFTGRGVISGKKNTAGIVTVNGKPARRRVFAVDQASLRFVRSTWSAEDGSYLLQHLDEKRQFIILALDNYNSPYRPVAWDKRYPKVPSD